MLWSHTCNFFGNYFFFISKKSIGSSAFQKNLQRLDQPTLFSHFLKKITTTGSSANFLSPDSNGQGFSKIHLHNTSKEAQKNFKSTILLKLKKNTHSYTHNSSNLEDCDQIFWILIMLTYLLIKKSNRFFA